ncbi:Cation/H(+) antiporter 15 [Apostasia shenzhenica]|uniref:Cation/H(+) antiporter 15 n=1 Tax=Apostasia shenzhenica TaxID=1088818 RepID=A0A2I0BH40_9ASPA|nr:Cation/H(+) antiporter 15 [Apostasia shenzhenica]
MTTTSGVWLGDDPFKHSFPVLLAQLTLIFLTTRLTHAVLRPVGLPQPLSHVIAGMLLGQSGLSRIAKFQKTIFPQSSWIHLDHISLLAFILFIFVVAVKTDFGLIRRSGRKAVAIGQLGTALPFIVVLIAVFANSDISNNDLLVKYLVYFNGRWALTSNIVVSCLLAEFNLLTSELGRLAMSASLIGDFHSLVASTVFVFFTARPIVIWIIRRTPDGSAMNEAAFLTVLFIAIGSSVAGELIGHSATLGPLLLGLTVPGGHPLGTAVVDRLERLVSALFLPVFLIIAGLRSNVQNVLSGRLWAPMTYLIVLSVASKFCGVIIACLCCKMPVRDAFVLALILNSRGIIEISTFNNLEKMSDELYTVNILGIVAVGGTTAVLLKAVYRPAARLAAFRRRTVQACAGAGELRMLTCVHGEAHVPPLLTLVNAFYPTVSSPLCVYLLHLTPLAGRSSAILKPYQKKATAAAVHSVTPTDHIVNSFAFLERQHPTGLLTIQPFIAISPLATMHDDVCSLAVDKMVDLILLPFHRTVDSDVSVNSVNPAVRDVNANVLLYAPCSVAILVNCGPSGGRACPLGARQLQRVAVFFLGGPDDREALAIAGRMADNPCIEVLAVRFVLPDDRMTVDSVDEEAVEEFRRWSEGVDSVECREEVVRDGAETVGVMREKSEFCSLFIVGKGEGRASPFTAGLEMWSEFPELGVIGDILASPDFGGEVSVLVVQQRSRIAGANSSGGLDNDGR